MAQATKRSKKVTPKRRPRRAGRAPARPASAAPRRRDAAIEVSSPYRLHDDELERLLRSPADAPVLEEYFGEANYRELRDLAQEASATRVRGGPRVLVLPGIMGSKLGRKRLLFDDVIWIDPIDVARGKLAELALPSKGVEALGVILLAYLKLKLRLTIAGYDVDFHPFDWRFGIDRLGDELLARVQGDPAPRVHIVAHSMGGLVTRAALARKGATKIGQFVMLGTPNFGSFAPVQALTASHPLVQRVIAAVDFKHDAVKLAGIFRSFPGLHQMLPSPERFNGVDLYDPKAWPSGPGPDPTILAGVRAVQDALAQPDERFFLIAGVKQETIVGARIEDGRFVYEISRDGDGTVPRAFAELPGATTYYVEEGHGSLPNNGTVEGAVIDILANGSTERLAKVHEPERVRAVRSVPAERLRETPYQGRRGAALSRAEARHVIDDFVSPDAHDRVLTGMPERVAAGGAAEPPVARLDQVVVSRRRQRPLEIRLVLGSIIDVRTRSYVLGLFREVDPSGAAAAIDASLDGAVKEFTQRRMFSAQIGEVFAMPAGRYRLGADTVLFAGLGGFDGFSSEVLQFVTENIVRTFVRTHVEDFATVLLGAGSGTSAAKSVYNHLAGFFRGLRDADHRQDLRRITFCEIDPERFAEMRAEVYRLASTSLFDDVQVTFSEEKLPVAATLPPVSERGRLSVASDTAYLTVRQEPAVDHKVVYRSSLLTSGSKATVLTGTCAIERVKLKALLDKIEKSSFNFGSLPDFGRDLAKLVLFPDVAAALARKELRGCHLSVVHDAATSQIPWETLTIGDWTPAIENGLSRRYAAENLSVAKWLEQRRYDRELDVLLVVNPTEDLDGANAEAARIEQIFGPSSRIRLHRLERAQATRAAVLAELRSGKYDVVHYAGHAQFDAEEPSLSGIVCSDARLTGADLAGLSNLPALVFFNACEAGRIRGARQRRRDVRKRIEANVGLAEAFLRGGVSSYIGTYWPVGDLEAAVFAERFYESLVAGESVGVAATAARRAIHQKKQSVDWADYTHYGSQDFVVKGLEREG